MYSIISSPTPETNRYEMEELTDLNPADDASNTGTDSLLEESNAEHDLVEFPVPFQFATVPFKTCGSVGDATVFPATGEAPISPALTTGSVAEISPTATPSNASWLLDSFDEVIIDNQPPALSMLSKESFPLLPSTSESADSMVDSAHLSFSTWDPDVSNRQPDPAAALHRFQNPVPVDLVPYNPFYRNIRYVGMEMYANFQDLRPVTYPDKSFFLATFGDFLTPRTSANAAQVAIRNQTLAINGYAYRSFCMDSLPDQAILIDKDLAEEYPLPTSF
jgi:hypothetical protein